MDVRGSIKGSHIKVFWTLYFHLCPYQFTVPISYELFQFFTFVQIGDFCSGIQFSLSLLYLLFISCFIRSRTWCIDTNQFYVSWSTSELRVRLAPWNRFESSSKIFYWPFQRDSLLLLWIFYVFFSVLCLLYLCARLFICALWSQSAGKGLTHWLSFVLLSLSHCYPG